MNQETPRADRLAVRWTEVKSDTFYVPRYHVREMELQLKCALEVLREVVDFQDAIKKKDVERLEFARKKAYSVLNYHGA